MSASRHVPPFPDPGHGLPPQAAKQARLNAWKGQAADPTARASRLAQWEQQ